MEEGRREEGGGRREEEEGRREEILKNDLAIGGLKILIPSFLRRIVKKITRPSMKNIKIIENLEKC